MQPAPAVHLATDDEPSKWWFWGLGIAVAAFSLLGVLGSGIGLLIPIDTYLADWSPEQPGPYPENGTSREQNEWNASKEEWDLLEGTTTMMDELEPIRILQFEISLVLLLIAAPTCFLLFSRNHNGFYAAGFWVVVNALGGAYLSWRTMSIVNSYLDDIPGMSSDFQMFSTGLNIAGQLVCNVTLLAVVVLAAVRSKDRGEIPESGFHRMELIGTAPIPPQRPPPQP